MNLTGIRNKVFLDRYSVKDKDGAPTEKTPEEMWRRVAGAVAAVEDGRKQKKWEDKFYNIMEDFKYVPGGRILAGAGTGYSVTYYNCFVIPSPKDSRGGILETLGQMVEIMAHGGGVGINLSSLRPRGDRVKKVNGFSSGPCNWAELFSVATKDIIQQGGSRRGALMLMLHDWHPDIEEFITVKQDLTRINGANLSLCVSDVFMDAVKADADWPLVFPDRSDPDYDEVWNGDLEDWKKLGKKVIVHKVVKAQKIWDLIAEAAWKSAEPGVVFLERYNKLHNNYYWNRIICVNPCGEEGLPAWGVCNLGSINLSSLVKYTDIDTAGEFDYEQLKEVVRTAVRFQDNVVDMDPYVFEGIRKTQLNGERRIGLGTMGLGDALIKMHLRYGAPESIPVIEKIYQIIRDEAYRASMEISKEKGAFKMFDKKLYPEGGFVKQLPEDLRNDIRENGIRNSVLLMQAPTGTTALLAEATSGIEPVYEFEFNRYSRLGKDVIRHYLYNEWYTRHEADVESGAVKRPAWFVSANDLTPEDHIMVQAAIQKYVDASISKTVNAPETHTIEDVKRLYTLAYDHGLKGIAYMREGSRQGVLERIEEKKPETVAPTAPVFQYAVKPRPMVVHGATYKVNTPVGKAYVTINTNGSESPMEVFINVGKAGTDVAAMAEGLGRMISLTLRLSTNLSPEDKIKNIISELSHIGGSSAVGFGKERVRSLPDAVAKVLSMHYELNSQAGLQVNSMNGNGAHASIEERVVPESLSQDVVVDDTATQQATLAEAMARAGSTSPAHAVSSTVSSSASVARSTHFDICPDCGAASLVHEEGCKKCYSCGFSAC